MKLSPVEIRAAVYIVRCYRATLAGKPPPPIAALIDRLEAAVRVGDVSPWRQPGGVVKSDWEHAEFVGTRLAARMLGWTERTVQRRASDLDGRKINDRWVFPAHSVREYRDHQFEDGSD